MTTAPAGHPDDDPETVYRSFLAADLRPLISTATTTRMRAAAAAAGEHLCGRLHRDTAGFTGIPSLGPDQRPPWAACQTGDALRAGLQLFHAVTQAIAGSYLTVMGFSPARAISDPGYHPGVITPALHAAPATRLRAILHALTAHTTSTTTDADTAAALAGSIDTHTPPDLWDVTTGTTTAIRLYQHTALTEAVQVRYTLWDNLAPGPALRPFPATLTIPAASPS
jgi:hypothetical protein